MFKTNIVIILLPALAAASLVLDDAQPLIRTPSLQARTDIPALLRSSVSIRGLRLGIRQGTCPAGDFLCADGTGCCRTGTYCDDIGGCCLNGQICAMSSGSCTFPGDVVCPGGDFCCPIGVTCLRNSNNIIVCGPGGLPAPPAVAAATITRTAITTLIKTTTPLATLTRTTTFAAATGTGTGGGSGSGSGSVISGSSRMTKLECGFMGVVTAITLAVSFFAL